MSRKMPLTAYIRSALWLGSKGFQMTAYVLEFVTLPPPGIAGGKEGPAQQGYPDRHGTSTEQGI